VEQVTWDEAKAFCEAAGGRLPSEAEWEYAARAGTTTIYYCGDDPACLPDFEWNEDNSDSKTHPTAGKTPNGFGLYDMVGNVSEWIEDHWHYSYDGAPTDGSSWYCDHLCDNVARGGNFNISATCGRSSYRSEANNWSRGNAVGFRCARDW